MKANVHKRNHSLFMFRRNVNGKSRVNNGLWNSLLEQIFDLLLLLLTKCLHSLSSVPENDQQEYLKSSS